MQTKDWSKASKKRASVGSAMKRAGGGSSRAGLSGMGGRPADLEPSCCVRGEVGTHGRDEGVRWHM
jgi:hypothetical protein